MNAIYAIPYRIWNALPVSLRHWIMRRRFLASPLQAIRKALIPYGRHDEIYDKRYFELIDSLAGSSTDAIAASIQGELEPSFVVDVGCGSGALLACLQAGGVNALGLEQSEAALALCRKRGLNVRKFDLECDDAPREHADVAISLEVAEHLPELVADRYVDLLCQLSGFVVLTAAQPGQGGTDHINEQPHSYWKSKFAERGFIFDEQLSGKWKCDWKNRGVAAFYSQNLMIFRRGVNRTV
jgi:SAM-dependent methyltransferase